MPNSKHTRKGKARAGRQGARNRTLSGKVRAPQPDDADALSTMYRQMFGAVPQWARPDAQEDDDRTYCHRCHRRHANGTPKDQWDRECLQAVRDQLSPGSLEECGPTGHPRAALVTLTEQTEPDTCRICGAAPEFDRVDRDRADEMTDHLFEALPTQEGLAPQEAHHWVSGQDTVDGPTHLRWNTTVTDQD